MIGLFNILELHLMCMEDSEPEMELDQKKLRELQDFCDYLDPVLIDGHATSVEAALTDTNQLVVAATVYHVDIDKKYFGDWDKMFNFPKKISFDMVFREEDGEEVPMVKMTFELPSVWKERVMN